MTGSLNLENGGTLTARTGRNALSEREIKRIKDLILLGIPSTEISKRFECSVETIKRIKRGMK